eukprot:TRINITY_DN57838_c0_g1_i1.p1 TRINITY_DN57838_c0_g1~~TRINITY_DN57838_c0_g1_i1.p1  ORF type:complete len:201 (-),score=46.97 TRINITY_DN57838_c0_g1_i1:1-603(-)
MQRGLVGSEMCIRDSINAEYMGPVKFIKMKQGTEPAEFWTLFPNAPEERYQHVTEWDELLEDLNIAEKKRPKDKPQVYSMNKATIVCDKEEEDLEEKRANKPRFYTFPKSEEFITIFDIEDFSPDIFAVLCLPKDHQAYVWKGEDFSGQESETQEFLSAVTKHCWDSVPASSIKTQELAESDLDSLDWLFNQKIHHIIHF